jgi:hypothetical protein
MGQPTAVADLLHAAALAAALLAFAAVALTRVVRALPFVRPLVEAGRKPWACDACMAAWTSVLWCVAAVVSGHVPLLVAAIGLAPAAGAAATLLTLTKDPLAPPPLPL